MQEILMTPDVCMRFLVWSYYYHDVMPHTACVLPENITKQLEK